MDRWSQIRPADESPDGSSSSSSSSASSAGGSWTKKQPAGEFSDMSSSSSSGGTKFSYKKFRARKKPAPRRADPGRRYRGNRVYDSAYGITCHFCRQKTTDKHVICCGRTCVLAFCGNCLQNRHGEDVITETMDEDYKWLCPKCRGGCGPGCKNCCNCSFCRQKQNLRPPKFPNSEMQARGFDNVHDYLIHLETGESPESIFSRKLGKGWCSTQKKSVPKSHEDVKFHKQKEVSTKKSSEEVINTQNFMSKMHKRRKTEANKGSNEVLSNSIHEESQRSTSKGEDVIKESNARSTAIKKSFPSHFSSRNEFKEKLKVKLAESFDSQELSELWDAINCRKRVSKAIEMPQGTLVFPTEELGSSYFMQHPDLARKLAATCDKVEKLTMLRSFFFWLEHASMSGSFKPWLEDDKDGECIELAGPDCEVLGELIKLDERKHGKDEEATKLNKTKQGAKESLSPRAKIIFNWDEEDVKPRVTEKWVQWAKCSSVNTRIHVKEEQDTS